MSLMAPARAITPFIVVLWYHSGHLWSHTPPGLPGQPFGLRAPLARPLLLTSKEDNSKQQHLIEKSDGHENGTKMIAGVHFVTLMASATTHLGTPSTKTIRRKIQARHCPHIRDDISKALFSKNSDRAAEAGMPLLLRHPTLLRPPRRTAVCGVRCAVWSGELQGLGIGGQLYTK
jgi:hypothetical protein